MIASIMTFCHCQNAKVIILVLASISLLSICTACKKEEARLTTAESEVVGMWKSEDSPGIVVIAFSWDGNAFVMGESLLPSDGATRKWRLKGDSLFITVVNEDTVPNPEIETKYELADDNNTLKIFGNSLEGRKLFKRLTLQKLSTKGD